MDTCNYFLLFLSYSILGWLTEVIYVYFYTKKFHNRGFFIGPWCPIYGIGFLLVLNLLKPYSKRPVGLFILSIVICAIVEYISSYILEKVFHTRWWDYSNRKYDINGRICLENLIPFGICCLVSFYLINPFLKNLIFSIPKMPKLMMAIVLGLIFITDVIISIKIIWNFKKISKNIRKDNSEKVTEYVKKEILKKKKILYTRLIKAYPSFTIFKNIKRK